MPNITYAFVERCAGGGHIVLDVSLDGGASRRVPYTTDDVRAPLSALTREEQESLALMILKVHFAGKTRAQITTEFQSGGGTVTVTV